MNEGLFFNDLNENDTFLSPTRTVTESDVMLFAGLTGDYNELHTSITFAEETPFGARIAHGMLTLAIANGLYARMGLFPSTVLLQINDWRFEKPVLIGDTIRLRLTIESKRVTKNPQKGICVMRYEVEKQNGEIAATGHLTRMVPVR